MQSLPKPLIQTLLRGALLFLMIVSGSSISAEFRPAINSSAVDEFARSELQHQQVPGIGLGIFW
jgi:hypothetical protein